MMLSSSSLVKANQVVSSIPSKIIATEIPTNHAVGDWHKVNNQFSKERQEHFEHELAKIEEQKFKILQEALAEAEQIKQKAYDEGYQLGEMAGNQQGYQTGYNEGYQKGYQEAKIETDNLLLQAKDSYQTALESSKQYIKEKEQQLIEASVQMTELLIEQSLKMDPEVVLSIVNPILVDLEQPDQLVTIRCHMNYVPLFTERLEKMKQEILNFRYVVLKDASMSPTELIVESENQRIELDVKQELQALLAKIKENE